MELHTLLGFQDAIAAAADLDACSDSTDDEYSRGQVELIKALFIRGDVDPGSDEARDFIERAIKEYRGR